MTRADGGRPRAGAGAATLRRCAAPTARRTPTRWSTRARRSTATRSGAGASASACGRRFTTYERLEPIPLTVRKRSGVTEPFDREKLARGLAQAVAGRAVAAEAVDALAADLAEWAESQGPEIASDAIGVAVLERLRTLDPVSYLRFASVYKGFEDLADFEAEVVGAPARRTAGAGPRDDAAPEDHGPQNARTGTALTGRSGVCAGQPELV